MSSSIRIFDPVTGRAKSINLDVEQGVLATENDGTVDTYLKLTVSAKTVGGSSIGIFVISNVDDLVLGTSQYDGSLLPYTSLSTAVDDYVLRMVHGVPGQPDTAMDFSS